MNAAGLVGAGRQPPGRFGAIGRIAAVALPSLAVAIFVLAAAGVDRTRTIQRELHPWPDGPEYVDGALELATRGEYRIHVAGESHPPRYPPGYSGALAVLILLGSQPIDAPYRLNFFCGLLLAGLVYAFLARGRRWIRAGLGALLLAALPAFSILCRSPMSDAAGACLGFGGVAALYLYAGGRRRLGVLGAWLLGVSACIRISNLFLVPFVLLAVAARERFQGLELVRLGTALGIGIAPLLVYNWTAFGNPFHTGYGYWLGHAALGQSFALENVARYAGALWRELAQTERELNTASIYGAGSYFGPAQTLLAAAGVAFLKRDRRNLWFLAAGAASVVPPAFYDFSDFRFLLPQMAMLCAVAAAGATRLFSRTLAERRWVEIGGLVLLTAAAVAGWPGARSDSELGDMIEPRAMFLNVSAPDLPLELRRRFGERTMTVVSDLPPPLVHVLTGGEGIAAPILNRHSYRFNPEKFFFEDAQRRQIVQRALDEGIPALALCVRCRIEDLDDMVPPPPGRVWTVLVRNEAGGGLAQLTE